MLKDAPERPLNSSLYFSSSVRPSRGWASTRKSRLQTVSALAVPARPAARTSAPPAAAAKAALNLISRSLHFDLPLRRRRERQRDIGPHSDTTTDAVAGTSHWIATT